MLWFFGKKAAPTLDEIAARPKAIVIKGLWTDDDEHDHYLGYRYGNEADAIADTNATSLDDEIRNRKCRDEDDLVAGHEYWYGFTSVDRWLNESERSVPVPVVFRPVQDGDNDQTEPNQPAGPTLTDTPGDFAPDGSVETGLTITITPAASGRSPKKHYVEIWRRKGSAGASGSMAGYSAWDDFTTPKLSRWRRANPLYFYKVRATPISANDVAGTPSVFSADGVQPTDNIPVPAITAITTITKGSRVWVKIAEVTDPRYNRTRVFTSLTNTFSGADFDGWMDAGTRYELTNFNAGDTVYVWVRNTLTGGKEGSRYPNTDPTSGHDGYAVVIPS